tara:strand:- start:840 stop:1139 length:300 start_codon:yes stop_codon:yes gene_type:complete
MIKYHLLISDEAKLDILDAHSWYQQHQLNLGHEFITNLDAAFTLLIQNPHSFQTKYKQIRICYLARFPFGIHYLIDNDEVKVVAVFHSSRDPKKWGDRL